MKEPLSVLSASVFLPLAVFVGVLGSVPLALSYGLLGVGTALFHATTPDSLGDIRGTVSRHWAATLDHAGMLATIGVLMMLGPGPWVGLFVGLILTPLYSHSLVWAGLVGVVIAALLSGVYLALLVGLALMGAAYLAWRQPGDAFHAAWHLLSGCAMTTLAVGYLA